SHRLAGVRLADGCRYIAAGSRLAIGYCFQSFPYVLLKRGTRQIKRQIESKPFSGEIFLYLIGCSIGDIGCFEGAGKGLFPENYPGDSGRACGYCDMACGGIIDEIRGEVSAHGAFFLRRRLSL
ncbi:MAG: hypothetical protein RR794_05285, partial [Raoultibacter sp.]